jgi:hypothetical protein
MIVGRQDARGAVRRPGDIENLGLREDPLHAGSAEKLGHDPAQGEPTPDGEALSPVPGGNDEEATVELELIHNT